MLSTDMTPRDSRSVTVLPQTAYGDVSPQTTLLDSSCIDWHHPSHGAKSSSRERLAEREPSGPLKNRATKIPEAT